MRELTELESLAQHYSDYHKDVYGFRPTCGEVTVDALRDAIAELDRIAPAIWEAEAVNQRENVARTEERIAEFIRLGAASRASAIRWLGDAEGADGDLEYLCYLLDIPYGYFKEAA
jgi:hypothetical protein